MAILVFTVTLASCALNFKLDPNTSVPDMQRILKEKRKERDLCLERLSKKALKEEREKKLDADLENLLNMGEDEGEETDPSAAASSSASAPVAAASLPKMTACKTESDPDGDNFKMHLMQVQGLSGAELEEEWMAWRAAHPTTFIATANPPPVLQAQPKKKGLQKVGDGKPKVRPFLGPIAPTSVKKPVTDKKLPKMRGSIITG